jgi:hypothetical protein
MLGGQESTMSETNERGGVHYRTLAKERTAARFSLEDILEQEQTGVGDIVGSEGEAMATEKQIAANRKNAKRSTGPRTDAGKTKSAMNSTRHGLRGRQFHLIAGEDPQEFSKFEEGIRADLKPEGALEEYFADRFIRDAWLLDRLDNVESALLVNKESLDDLSIDDLMTTIERLHRMGLQFFDRIPEIEKHLHDQEVRNYRDTQATPQNNKSDDGSNSKSAFAVGLSTAGLDLSEAQRVLDKNLMDRLVRMNLGTNKPQSSQTPTDADRTEGERGAPSTEEATNTMARAISRKRADVALVLRYRTKIDRSRDNDLNEFQRLQATRQGSGGRRARGSRRQREFQWQRRG